MTDSVDGFSGTKGIDPIRGTGEKGSHGEGFARRKEKEKRHNQAGNDSVDISQEAREQSAGRK